MRRYYLLLAALGSALVAGCAEDGIRVPKDARVILITDSQSHLHCLVKDSQTILEVAKALQASHAEPLKALTLLELKLCGPRDTVVVRASGTSLRYAGKTYRCPLNITQLAERHCQ